MEDVLNGNMRILIGQYLGEIYLIIQKYINNRWQHTSNNKYRGTYYVNKILNELLKNNVHSIRKNSKNDMVKFRIADTLCVYVTDYSMIKDYPALKNLNKVLIRGAISEKLSNQMTFVKEKYEKLTTNEIMKILLYTGLSVSILGITDDLNMSDKDEYNKAINLTNNQLLDNDYASTFNQGLDVINLKKIEKQILMSELDIEEENKLSEEEQMIMEYADMYFMDYETVSDMYYANYDEIVDSSNPKLTFILMVKDAFYANDLIDKEPIMTTLTSEEKEKCILNIARDIYKVEDENTLALLIAIHRLETSWGESDRCLHDNNPGGVKEGNDFLTFKTFEIGAESFVRNVLKIKNLTINENNSENNIEYAMQKIYCEGQNSWANEVKEIKDDILSENVLESYLDSSSDKKYIKK